MDADLRRELEVLAACRRDMTEIHTGYDRVLFNVVTMLGERCEALEAEIAALDERVQA